MNDRTMTGVTGLVTGLKKKSGHHLLPIPQGNLTYDRTDRTFLTLYIYRENIKGVEKSRSLWSHARRRNTVLALSVTGLISKSGHNPVKSGHTLVTDNRWSPSLMLYPGPVILRRSGSTWHKCCNIGYSSVSSALRVTDELHFEEKFA